MASSELLLGRKRHLAPRLNVKPFPTNRGKAEGHVGYPAPLLHLIAVSLAALQLSVIVHLLHANHQSQMKGSHGLAESKLGLS